MPGPRRSRCCAVWGSEDVSELESQLQRQNARPALSGERSDIGVGVSEVSGRSGKAAGYCPQRTRSEREAAVHAGELHMVQDVERFQFELEFAPFSNCDLAGDGDIVIDV